MPYDHDEVVNSVIDFYNSLSTKLHFNPCGFKGPPPIAWSQINQPRFAFLGKTNKVLELLLHLPYLPAGPESKCIYDHTVCADYTDDEAVDKHAKYSDRDLFEPAETVGADDCPWEKFASRHEHLAVLGKPEVSDRGFFIFLDTLDGEVAVWDIGDIRYSRFDSAKEAITLLRRQFEHLEVFPVPNVERLTREPKLKDIIRSFGWPPEGNGGGWKREECFKELGMRWRWRSGEMRKRGYERNRTSGPGLV